MQQERIDDNARYFGIYRKYRANEMTYRTAVLWDRAGWHWRAYEGLWGTPFTPSARGDSSPLTDGQLQKELGRLVAQGGPFSNAGDAERDSNSWIQRNVAGVVDVYREVYSWVRA